MEKQIGRLIVLRPQESEWNKLGIWTGVTEIHLSSDGVQMAYKIGLVLKNFKIDRVFYSGQIRTKETLDKILEALNLVSKIPEEKSEALNERDYGDYTGKNKWEMKDKVGEETFNNIRRGWDYPVPNGETLKMVYDRAVPYYLDSVLPHLLEGENVLIVAHGNSIRALMKYIEQFSDEEIQNVEMPLNEILIYNINEKGHSFKKEVQKVK